MAPDEATGPAGISIVGDRNYQSAPETEAVRLAWSEALDMAKAHPDDFAYSWVEPETQILEVSVSSSLGDAIATDHHWENPAKWAIRTSDRSYAVLEALKDHIWRLRDEKIDGAEYIFMLTPDHQVERIIITVSELTDKLAETLVGRFGANAIAVHVDPNFKGAQSAVSRQDDRNPFWGGALIYPSGCSSAFAWTVLASVDGMLTAAHCARNGGAVSVPYESVGSVTASAEENWDVGTAPYSGQTAYRGDVALIRIASPKFSEPRIYRGRPTSRTSSHVAAMNPGYLAVGQKGCTGGRATGEICGFEVQNTGIDVYYVNEGATVKNVVQADAPNTNGCIGPGDSGGSVFHKRTDGDVTAFGVISGYFDLGFYGCRLYFTDIRESYYGLPGTLKT